MTYNVYAINPPTVQGAKATVVYLFPLHTLYNVAQGCILKKDNKYYLVAMIEVDGAKTNLICNYVRELNIDLGTKFSTSTFSADDVRRPGGTNSGMYGKDEDSATILTD